MTAGFPRHGKPIRGFSTQWKNVFHVVENFAAPLTSDL